MCLCSVCLLLEHFGHFGYVCPSDDSLQTFCMFLAICKAKKFVVFQSSCSVLTPVKAAFITANIMPVFIVATVAFLFLGCSFSSVLVYRHL